MDDAQLDHIHGGRIVNPKKPRFIHVDVSLARMENHIRFRMAHSQHTLQHDRRHMEGCTDSLVIFPNGASRRHPPDENGPSIVSSQYALSAALAQEAVRGFPGITQAPGRRGLSTKLSWAREGEGGLNKGSPPQAAGY